MLFTCMHYMYMLQIVAKKAVCKVHSVFSLCVNVAWLGIGAVNVIASHRGMCVFVCVCRCDVHVHVRLCWGSKGLTLQGVTQHDSVLQHILHNESHHITLFHH